VKEKINKLKPEHGHPAEKLTRRNFIRALCVFSMAGLARPFIDTAKPDVERERPEYIFVNGWLIRNDDYEKIIDAS
jgi:hypothetical protein